MFKTKQKVLIAFLFVIFLTVVFAGSFFARDVKVFYNGNEIKYDVPTKIVNDYAMVPLSGTLEAIYGRGTVYDPASRSSVFHANGHVYTHTIGSNILYIDGAAKTYNASSLIDRNRALVPTKMIADITGCSIQWDSVNYYVMITKPLPAATPVPVVQATASPTSMPSVPAAVIAADLNKNAIALGESVTFTIKTNDSTKYVWVSDGMENIPAIFAWEGADGIKTWVLAYKASKSTNFSISANTVSRFPETAMKSLALTVSAPTPSPSPTPAAAAVIYSADPNTTYVDVGGAVTFTIRTNSAANYVWVDYNNGTVSTASYSSTDLNGVKVWTVTVYPGSTQQINIRAGATQWASNAAFYTHYITVGGYAAITGGPYADPQTIYSGQSTTITVTTSSGVNYVWADIGDGRDYVYFDCSSNYYDRKTWTASVSLYSSRTVYVYAGAYQGSGYTQATVYVTVQGQYPDYINVDFYPSYVIADTSSSQSFQFTVTTNPDVTGVEAVYKGSAISGTFQSQSGNYKVWHISVPIQWNGTDEYETVDISYYSPYAGRNRKTINIPIQQP